MKVVLAVVDNWFMLKKKKKLSFWKLSENILEKYSRDKRSQDRLGFLKVKGEKERQESTQENDKSCRDHQPQT